MPDPFVFSDRVKPVCGLVTVTAAPTSTAPVESVTRPVIWPNVWPNEGAARASSKARMKTIRSSLVHITHPMFPEIPDRQQVADQYTTPDRLRLGCFHWGRRDPRQLFAHVRRRVCGR